jgi:hypothetical protein
MKVVVLIISCVDAQDVRAILAVPKFSLSLQDDLMRIFGSERLDNMLVKLGL